MSPSKLVLIVFWTAVSVFAGIWIVRDAGRLGQQHPEPRALEQRSLCVAAEQLITAVDGTRVTWGYAGQRTADAVENISVGDVRWLYERIGGLTDQQLADALRASGATAEEVVAFTTAILERIQKLRSVAQADG